MTLVKWWADITKSCNPLHERLPIIERQQVYLAAAQAEIEEWRKKFQKALS